MTCYICRLTIYDDAPRCVQWQRYAASQADAMESLNRAIAAEYPGAAVSVQLYETESEVPNAR